MAVTVDDGLGIERRSAAILLDSLPTMPIACPSRSTSTAPALVVESVKPDQIGHPVGIAGLADRG